MNGLESLRGEPTPALNGVKAKEEDSSAQQDFNKNTNGNLHSPSETQVLPPPDISARNKQESLECPEEPPPKHENHKIFAPKPKTKNSKSLFHEPGEQDALQKKISAL